jgi:hypothetical protein
MYGNGKMITVETIPGMKGGEGVNSNMIHLIFARTFVNATMYPYPGQ